MYEDGASVQVPGEAVRTLPGSGAPLIDGGIRLVGTDGAGGVSSAAPRSAPLAMTSAASRGGRIASLARLPPEIRFAPIATNPKGQVRRRPAPAGRPGLAVAYPVVAATGVQIAVTVIVVVELFANPVAV